MVWKGAEGFQYYFARAVNGLLKVCRGQEYLREASVLETYLVNENLLLRDRVRRLEELRDLAAHLARPGQPRPD
jgi:hypothetical protein